MDNSPHLHQREQAAHLLYRNVGMSANFVDVDRITGEDFKYLLFFRAQGYGGSELRLPRGQVNIEFAQDVFDLHDELGAVLNETVRPGA